MEPTGGSLGRSPEADLRESKDRIAIETIELCRELSIRAMLGGGPVLIANQLMSPIISRNASIVVDPASIRHLYLALRARGWEDTAQARRLRILPSARLALHREGEPAGLILYSVIPGFFADPEETFDLIWERHKELTLRGTRIRVLGRVASAVLASHDGLDGRASRQRSNFDYFVEQFRRQFDEHERAVVGDMIRKFGGCVEMARMLEALGLEPCAFTLPSTSYVQWRLQVTEVSDQMRRAVAMLELGRHGRSRLYAGKSGRPHSVRDIVVLVTSLPATIRAILGAQRRWRRAFVID